MKTPEEIKEALRRGLVVSYDRKNLLYIIICQEKIAIDALTYIDQLEERISLMLIQMRGDCGVCKHRDEENGPCDTCMHDEDRHGWEYEGLPGDE